jgi:transcriptional regulator with XRE-family HTH domain
MAILDIGPLVKRLRKQRGLTQEELAFGIIDQAALSKLERGLAMPHKKTMESLLERLGYNPSIVADLPIDKKSAEHQKILNELDSLLFLDVMDENDPSIIKAGELIKDLENDTIFMENKLNQQLLLCKKGMFIRNISHRGALDEQIKMLTKAMRITIPNFDISKIDQYVLSRNELQLIGLLLKTHKDAGDTEKYIEGFYCLKRSYDEFCIDKHEMGRTYPNIIQNLVGTLQAEGRHDEAIELCDTGIKVCQETHYMACLPLLAWTKALCLYNLGDIKASTELYKQAYYTFLLQGPHGALKNLTKNMTDLGIDIGLEK